MLELSIIDVEQYSKPEAPANDTVGRRSKMETICDILGAVSQGATKPTRIMYKANLSWSVTQIYIKSLNSNGLLLASYNENKTQYHLTEKGIQVLHEFLTLKKGLNLSNAH